MLCLSYLFIFFFGTQSSIAMEVPSNYAFPAISGAQATAGFSILDGPKGKRQYTGQNKAHLLPDGYEGNPRYRYQLFSHKKVAPLIFILPGLGGAESGGAVNFLAQSIYEQGYHVACLGSTFTPEFAALVARSPYVGQVKLDAQDMYPLMVGIKKELSKKIKIKGVGLTGFSFGAIVGAHLASVDRDKKQLNFSSIVLMNPPVDLLYGMHKLDDFYNESKKHSNLAGRISSAISWALLSNEKSSRHMTVEKFMDFLNILDFSDAKITSTVALAFRETLKEVVYTSQELSDASRFTGSKQQRKQMAAAIDFTAYVSNLVARSYETLPGGSGNWIRWYGTPRFDIHHLNWSNSLYSIEDDLNRDDRVYILHNADDFLVTDEHLRFLRDTMGNRLTVFPRGGHLGNMWFPQNLEMYFAQLAKGF